MKYLFEVSWEVCNMVGGIHTVLKLKSSEAKAAFGDNYFLIGPLLKNNTDFEETDEPDWADIQADLASKGLGCKLGRWRIPSNPKAILVDFRNRYTPDKVLFNYWQQFGVDSLSGGWDYVEPVLFSTACGEVIESIHSTLNLENEPVVAHFHEWMTGGGLLYLKKNVPEIGTVFTAHATNLGRAMASSGKNFYSVEIDAVAESKQFGVQAKVSLETTCAREADVFTTVSEVTAEESAVILQARPHFVVSNGLDGERLPDFDQEREKGHAKRKELLELASRFLQRDLPKNTRLFMTSGRYEYHNKGYDVLLEALAKLDEEVRDDITIPPIIVWFLIATENQGKVEIGSDGDKDPMLTHYLNHVADDPIVNTCQRLGLTNRKENKVQVIFTPAYLDGNDGIINTPYNRLLPAFDLGVFPSYYEPWGYTPLESIAAGVPTITSDLAGFGRWVRDIDRDRGNSVVVIERAGRNDEEVAGDLLSALGTTMRLGGQGLNLLRANARKIAERADWKLFYKGYLDAYETAWNMVDKRLNTLDTSSFSENLFISYKREDGPGPHYQTFTVAPALPQALSGLRDIAENMWWAWHPEAQSLFEEIDAEHWESCNHNPIKLLSLLDPKDIEKKVDDRVFLAKYEKVHEEFRTYMESSGREFQEKKLVDESSPIVYFSMEFGLHECLPIYSGGLGVLAGDHLKAASDLNIPLIGIGMLYKQGYFTQRIDMDGNQLENYPHLDTAVLPVTPVLLPDGQEARISVQLGDRKVLARVWLVKVGRVSLYLFDSDVDENRIRDRSISSRLYGGDRTTRIEQEILLGLGGVQLMEDILKKTPSVYHLNEGHCGFALFERIRRFIEKGLDFQEAREAVKATSVFTTHTPVPAGNEEFDHRLLANYFTDFAPKMNTTFEQLLEMGLSRPGGEGEPFSMTVLALKLTCQANAVSKLHGVVCREMWRGVWRDVALEEVPIGAITNGVHLTSWIGKNMRNLLGQYLKLDWDQNHDDEMIWERVDAIPNEMLWYEHMSQKENLIETVKQKIMNDYVTRGESAALISDTLKQLDPRALTFGFARRFATYKRATLLFQNRDSLVKLLNNPDRPVQILFAGKAHPADPQGKALIRRIIEESRSDEFRGKIIYLENYDMALGRLLTQGVDVWLNTPIRPHEASGTSGMKTVANGGLNCSVLDGWWDEAYEPGKGWAIHSPSFFMSDKHKNEMDTAALMSILEHEIVPLYYDMNDRGVPVGWIKNVKSAMKSFAPYFSTMRMVDQYQEKMYLPTAARGRELLADNAQGIKKLTEWKRRLSARFSTVQIDDIKVSINNNQSVDGQVASIEISMVVTPGKLRPEELHAELVIGLGDGERFNEDPAVVPFADMVPSGANQLGFNLSHPISRSGGFMYAIRVVPYHALLARTQETGLVLWA